MHSVIESNSILVTPEVRILNEQIRNLTVQSLNSSYRIMSVCEATERLGIETTTRLNAQYETVRNIHDQLDRMDMSLRKVERNLRTLKKSKWRSILEHVCCCWLCWWPCRSCKKRKKKRKKQYDENNDKLNSISSSEFSSSSNFYTPSLQSFRLQKSSKDSLHSTATSRPAILMNTTKSETFVETTTSRRKRGHKYELMKKRQTTISLVNLREKPSLTSRSLKSLKSALSSVGASSLRLVKSTVSSSLNGSKSSVKNNGQQKQHNSIEMLEKHLDVNMLTINCQLDSLQAMSRDISKTIDAKNGNLSIVNRFTDQNITHVRTADHVGRRLYKKNIKKK